MLLGVIGKKMRMCLDELGNFSQYFRQRHDLLVSRMDNLHKRGLNFLGELNDFILVSKYLGRYGEDDQSSKNQRFRISTTYLGDFFYSNT